MHDLFTERLGPEQQRNAADQAELDRIAPWIDPRHPPKLWQGLWSYEAMRRQRAGEPLSEQHRRATERTMDAYGRLDLIDLEARVASQWNEVPDHLDARVGWRDHYCQRAGNTPESRLDAYVATLKYIEDSIKRTLK